MTVLSLKEILEGPKISNWSGSSKSFDMVSSQVEKIWGKSELKNYSADNSALPYSKWQSLGYKPKRGSHALKSVIIIEKKDSLGNVISSYPKTINLFYYRSVEPITK
jgi:hypothetical protein